LDSAKDGGAGGRRTALFSHHHPYEPNNQLDL
jgi:hypothetical protein